MLLLVSALLTNPHFTQAHQMTKQQTDAKYLYVTLNLLHFS